MAFHLCLFKVNGFLSILRCLRNICKVFVLLLPLLLLLGKMWQGDPQRPALAHAESVGTVSEYVGAPVHMHTAIFFPQVLVSPCGVRATSSHSYQC